MSENKTQQSYSASGSKELLQKVLNDPKYVILRWNPAKKVYDEVYPYQVYRNLIKKTIQDAKFPNRNEIDVVDEMVVKVHDELVELLPELVSVHLENDMKFRLPQTKDFNGVLYKKFVPAGEKISDVRNIKENRVDGQVKSVWTDHSIIKCSSKRPKDSTTKTRIK